MQRFVILNPRANGIDQISAALAEARHVDAIHFVTHGSDGSVQLGNTALSNETLGLFTDQIVRWSHALTLDADLYFYGCDLASSDNGVELLESLQSITGADLAASDDLTGHASLGGDWELEYQTGEINEAEQFFSRLQESWMSLLAADLQPDSFSTNENDGLAGNVLVNDSTDGFDFSVIPDLNYDANLDTEDFGAWREENGYAFAHLLLDPGVTNDFDPTNAPNAIEGAFKFDGTGIAAFDDVPSAMAAIDEDDSVSFELWFNPSDADGQEILFDIGNLQGTTLKLNDEILEFNASDLLTSFPTTITSLTTTVDLSSELTAGEYIHFVGVLDVNAGGTTMNMYVNGQLVDSDSNAGFFEWADGYLDATALGGVYGSAVAASPGFDNYVGEMAAFSVYGQALNAAQIQQNYDNAFLTVTGYDSVSNLGASIVMDPQGNFSYLPGTTFDYLEDGESVIDVFQYTAMDADGNSNIETVQVQVNGQNDAPVAGPALLETTDETTAAFSIDLLDGTVDPEGQSLSVQNLTLVSGDDAGVRAAGNTLDVDPGAYSRLSVGQSETIAYSYEIVDDSGAATTQTATIVVSGVDLGAPAVGGALVELTHEDQSPFNINLLNGATDPDGGGLSVAALDLVSGNDAGISVVGSTLKIDPNAYNSLAVGQTEVLQYQYEIVDENGDSVAQSLTVQIEGRNDSPAFAAKIVRDVDENDAGFTINLLADASDPDTSDTLNITDFRLHSGNAVGVSALTGSTLTIDPDAYDYLEDGQVETIEIDFNIDDGNGSAVSRKLMLNITGTNDVPFVTSAIDEVMSEDDGLRNYSLLDHAGDLDATG